MATNLLNARFSTLQAPPNLFDQVMRGLTQARLRRARLRLGVAVGSFACLVVLAMMYRQTLLEEWQTSGFTMTFRLIASDPDIFLGSIKDFLLVMAETLPIMGLLVALATSFMGVFTAQAAKQYQILVQEMASS